MMRDEFHGQLYTTREFTSLVFDVITNLRGMKSMKSLDLQIKERIMLSVTAINDCIYCENYHSKVATNAGIQRAELDLMLNNQFTEAPEEQLVALVLLNTMQKIKVQ